MIKFLLLLLISCGEVPAPLPTPTPTPRLECGQDEYEVRVKIVSIKDGKFWSEERISGVCNACEAGKEYRLCKKMSNLTYGEFRILEEVKPEQVR